MSIQQTGTIPSDIPSVHPGRYAPNTYCNNQELIRVQSATIGTNGLTNGA